MGSPPRSLFDYKEANLSQEQRMGVRESAAGFAFTTFKNQCSILRAMKSGCSKNGKNVLDDKGE